MKRQLWGRRFCGECAKNVPRMCQATLLSTVDLSLVRHVDLTAFTELRGGCCDGLRLSQRLQKPMALAVDRGLACFMHDRQPRMIETGSRSPGAFQPVSSTLVQYGSPESKVGRYILHTYGMWIVEAHDQILPSFDRDNSRIPYHIHAGLILWQFQ